MELPVGPEELGLVTTAVALAAPPRGLGLTRSGLHWRVSSGRWQRLHRGVYLDRPGPVDWLTRAGAALLAYGDEAALGGASAAYLWGLGEQPREVHVVLPTTARASGHAWTQLRRVAQLRAFERWPRRTSFEMTVVDLAEQGDADELAGLLNRALRERRTTVARLRAELEVRPRHRQRRLLADLLTETESGCEGPLERRFVSGVLRRHGLPIGEAQLGLGELDVAGRGAGPERRRVDRALREWRILIELDGALVHAGRGAADRAKSNLAARAVWLLLRYGWHETVDLPCQTAAELVLLLRERGWRGRPRACGPGCAVGLLVNRAG